MTPRHRFRAWGAVVDWCERWHVPERLTRLARQRKLLAWCDATTAKRHVEA